MCSFLFAIRAFGTNSGLNILKNILVLHLAYYSVIPNSLFCTCHFFATCHLSATCYIFPTFLPRATFLPLSDCLSQFCQSSAFATFLPQLPATLLPLAFFCYFFFCHLSLFCHLPYFYDFFSGSSKKVTVIEKWQWQIICSGRNVTLAEKWQWQKFFDIFCCI